MTRWVLRKVNYNINCYFINYFLQLLSAKEYLCNANIALIFTYETIKNSRKG